ncbi:MAG: hypothetical protein JWN43_1682 [Gammaproteobacteria bacterium]|nr:hypothetical protein [Gammaproteobacteria bacterium]
MALPHLEHLHIYQVQRVEDGRTRFRLRLGPITSELEADALLAGVRQLYPVALTATAAEDDHRAMAAADSAAARNGLVRSDHDRSNAPAPALRAPVPPTPVPPTPVPPTLEVAAKQPRRTTATAPSASAGAFVAKPVPFGRLLEINPAPLPAVDNTQTLRALSVTEFDDALSKWFVIQLAVAEDAFSPEDVLNLDIFNEFSLYSSVGLEEGRLMHALRLGFFTDQSAALTVASYVRQHFGAAVVKRVSSSEHERFAEGRVVARKHSEATGIHEVIELSTPPAVPATNLSTMSTRVKNGSADGSLKSAVVPSRRR